MKRKIKYLIGIIACLVVVLFGGNEVLKNNHISNLRQVSQKDNIQNALLHGNFGHNHNTKIKVFDDVTGKETIFNSVKDFLISINAPEYMINHGGLNNIYKRKEYKRYHITKINEH